LTPRPDCDTLFKDVVSVSYIKKGGVWVVRLGSEETVLNDSEAIAPAEAQEAPTAAEESINVPEPEGSETQSELEAVNPATVPQRSPLRYPGGKTWLIPIVRKWLASKAETQVELCEPFAGGAIVGLTAAFEELTDSVTLIEFDPDVAALWRTILYGSGAQLAERYSSFTPTVETVQAVLDGANRTLAERAFVTLMRNRISRGGILAPGAGILKQGEKGKGLMSRWYPDTIRQRILDLVGVRHRVHFIQADGLSYMEANMDREDIAWFIDPPYTVAGKRLYTYSEIDHEYLFHLTARVAGDFLMTYDETEEIKQLAERHGFLIRRVKMKTTHHEPKYELLIGRHFAFLA
jgi:DNA adenine methylase